MQRYVMVGILVSGLLVVGATAASAQDWGRPRMPQIGACFYEDVHFGGRYFCSRVGTDNGDVPPGTNDEISSIRIFGNAEVTVFRDRGFDGRSSRFTSDVEDLGQSGWNDRISSFRIGTSHDGNWDGNWGRPPAPASGACFYQDVNFAGRYFCTRAGAWIDQVPRETNDRISSIRVFGNATVTVFRDRDFEGESRRFGSDTPDLRRSGWNDRISSFQVGGRGFNNGRPGGGQGQWGGGRMTAAQAEAIVRSAYLSVLGREPDPASRGYVTRVMSYELTQAQLEAELRKSAEYREKQRQRR